MTIAALCCELDLSTPSHLIGSLCAEQLFCLGKYFFGVRCILAIVNCERKLGIPRPNSLNFVPEFRELYPGRLKLGLAEPEFFKTVFSVWYG